MLASKLNGMLSTILSQYSELGISGILNRTISMLHAREAGQDNTYAAHRIELLKSISEAIKAEDPVLHKDFVASYLSKSAYTSLCLPHNLLSAAQRMANENMSLASSSTEAKLLKSNYDRFVQEFSVASGVLSKLGELDVSESDESSNLKLIITYPQKSLSNDLGKLADFSRELDDLTKTVSLHYTSAEKPLVLTHLSMSDLVYYVELAKEMAPIFLQIWHTAAVAAKALLDNRALIDRLLGLPQGSIDLESIKRGMDTGIEAKMVDALTAIAADAVLDDKSGTIKAKLHKSVETLSRRISEGATIEIETEMEITVSFFKNVGGGYADEEQVQHLIANTSMLQSAIQRDISDNEHKTLIEDKRLPPS